jgi:hypothetical protein
VYFFRSSKAKVSKTSFFSGSTLGTVSSMYVSCSSFGFYLATIFGSAGVAASTFMPNYQMPLGLVAIGVLVLAYYSTHKRILGTCSAKLI